MTTTDEKDLEQEIFRGLVRWRSPFKVATKLGLPISQVYDVLAKHPDVMGVNTRRPEIYDGEGPPNLRQYAVAKKKVLEPWDNYDPSIVLARKNYNAGTHDMFTGRDGSWLILYSRPRAVPVIREIYFDS